VTDIVGDLRVGGRDRACQHTGADRSSREPQACQDAVMILVAGEALVDLVIDPDGRVEAALGGGPFNLARAVARLGGEVELVATLSDDRFGALLRERLDHDGVGARWAPRTALPTTLAAAELDVGGHARYRFYVASTSAPCLVPDDVAVVDVTPDVVVTGGLGLVLRPMADTIARMVVDLPRSTMVCVDLNVRPLVIDDPADYVDRVRAVLGRADLVKVSDDDLEHLAVDLGLDLGVERAIGLLGMGASAVVVTRGADATEVHTRSGSRRVPVPAPPGPVVDTIGAGDTFTAALLVALLAEGEVPDLRTEDALDRIAAAVAAAHQVAGVVVTRRGADPPRRADLPPAWPG
jgi:fructokinase